jgi:hypothetical protein
MLDEPKNEQWGSEAAAPIFAAIGRDVLRYLEVPPADAQPVQLVTGSPAEAKVETAAGAPLRVVPAAVLTSADGFRTMPDLRGKTLRQALIDLEPLRVGVELSGQGRIVEQAPAPGEPLAPGTSARLVFARRGNR